VSDRAPKSALEIALERLRQKDAAEGVVEQPLSDAQREAIAEARNYCEAKIAELKILHHAALASTWEPDARAKLEDEHRRDIERLSNDRDRKIDRIRRGDA
jgi:hypothetical protein